MTPNGTTAELDDENITMMIDTSSLTYRKIIRGQVQHLLRAARMRLAGQKKSKRVV
jgi:hypothetical protein